MGQPNPPADGATPPANPNPTDPAATPPPATGDGLGDAGKRALAEERAARKELEKQLKELQGRDPLKELLAKLGAAPEPGSDPAKALESRLAAIEKREREAELRDLKAEVATAKGLTPAQAKRLTGSTREELEADADDLLAAFQAQAVDGKPGTPKPDPSQGPRSGGAPGKLSADDVKRLYAEGKYAEIEKARVEGRIDYGTANKR